MTNCLHYDQCNQVATRVVNGLHLCNGHYWYCGNRYDFGKYEQTKDEQGVNLKLSEMKEGEDG